MKPASPWGVLAFSLQVHGFVVSSEGCGSAKVSDGLATEREEVV